MLNSSPALQGSFSLAAVIWIVMQQWEEALCDDTNDCYEEDYRDQCAVSDWLLLARNNSN